MGKKIAQWLELAVEIFAGSVLMVMMMLTVVDVAGRKFFNLPLLGSVELTELTLVVLIYSGLPLVSRHGEHVVVDLFERWMSTWIKRLLTRIAHLLCALALVGMAWLMYLKGNSLAEEGAYTNVLKVHLAPFIYAMAGMVLATALIHFLFMLVPSFAPGEGDIESAV
jgi:TRAP-type C4-dicarboxylate transport system permease small subunit